MQIGPGCSLSVQSWSYQVIRHHTLNVFLPVQQVPRHLILNLTRLPTEEQQRTVTDVTVIKQIAPLDLKRLTVLKNISWTTTIPYFDYIMMTLVIIILVVQGSIITVWGLGKARAKRLV